MNNFETGQLLKMNPVDIIGSTNRGIYDKVLETLGTDTVRVIETNIDNSYVTAISNPSGENIMRCADFGQQLDLNVIFNQRDLDQNFIKVVKETNSIQTKLMRMQEIFAQILELEKGREKIAELRAEYNQLLKEVKIS